MQKITDFKNLPSNKILRQNVKPNTSSTLLSGSVRLEDLLQNDYILYASLFKRYNPNSPEIDFEFLKNGKMENTSNSSIIHSLLLKFVNLVKCGHIKQNDTLLMRLVRSKHIQNTSLDRYKNDIDAHSHYQKALEICLSEGYCELAQELLKAPLIQTLHRNAWDQTTQSARLSEDAKLDILGKLIVQSNIFKNLNQQDASTCRLTLNKMSSEAQNHACNIFSQYAIKRGLFGVKKDSKSKWLDDLAKSVKDGPSSHAIYTPSPKGS